jgi:Calcineurin-like phosphoesterase.
MSEAPQAQQPQAASTNPTELVENYTYAIGDIHGSVAPLKSLLKLLPLQPQDTLVFLGDYMDRGKDSVGVIRLLQQIQQSHPNSIFLRGNHDDSWLEFWNTGKRKFERPPYMPGARQIWQEWHGKIPADVGEWLSKTRIDYEDQYAYYVHAGVTPNMPFSQCDTFIKLWGDADFFKTRYQWQKLIVFGHYQMKEPLIEPYKIGIDTGAYQTGILTAIRLPDRKLFQTRPDN